MQAGICDWCSTQRGLFSLCPTIFKSAKVNSQHLLALVHNFYCYCLVHSVCHVVQRWRSKVSSIVLNLSLVADSFVIYCPCRRVLAWNRFVLVRSLAPSGHHMPRYIDYLKDYRFDLGHVLQSSLGSHRLHFNSSCRITKYVEFIMVKYHVNHFKAFSDFAKLVYLSL